MNVHEYQAKQILQAYGVHILNGFLAETPEDIQKYARQIETSRIVVKAQIHSGGRGKAGGVKLASSVEEAVTLGSNMLGSKLVTEQTGPEGKWVHKIYLEEACDIGGEFYLSFVLDRASGNVMLIASRHGGMDIEAISKTHPKAVHKIPVSPHWGIRNYHAQFITEIFGVERRLEGDVKTLLEALFTCFLEKDLTLVEINPLVLTQDSELVALDCKMNFDDNALVRHADIAALRDLSEENPKELEAGKAGIAYVALDGNIGCLVNGAGLAMATMDAVHAAGGHPANFLDVGGSASAEQIENALHLMLSDPNVKGIFVNIFGGIMHCDTVATGIVNAIERWGSDTPFVVRLSGTNADLGRDILKSSGHAVTLVDSMDSGSDLIVRAIAA